MALPAGAVAQSFNSVVVFGDSLSDTGNAAVLFGAPARSGFTTNPDPVWSRILAEHFGGENAGLHSLAGGLVAAYGGACTDEQHCRNPLVPTIPDQADGYFSALGGTVADPNALYAIWAGSNDLLGTLDAVDEGMSPQDAAALIAARAQIVVAQTESLRDAGARNVLVFNLADPSGTPDGALLSENGRALLTGLSAAFNAALEAGIREREHGIVPVDVATMFAEVRADPAAFGITDATGAACGLNLLGSLFCGPAADGYDGLFHIEPDTSETYLFADGLHPSGTTHAVLADAVLATLAAPVQISLAGEPGVQAWSTHRAAVAAESGLNLGSDQPEGSWRGYVRAGLGSRKLGELPGFDRPDVDLASLTLGGDYKLGPGRHVGAAVSFGNHSSSAAGSELDGQSAIVSVHGTLRFGDAHYLTGGLGLGNVSLDIDRNLALGAVARRVERGDTRSNPLGFDVEAGWQLRQGEIYQQHLFFGATGLDQTVEGYRETGDASTSMNVSDFTRDSLVLRAGWQLRGASGESERWLRVALMTELEDDPVSVTAGSNTMPGRFTLSGHVPESNWVHTDVGIRMALTDDVHASAGYTLRVGADSGPDHGGSVGIRIRF